MRARDNVALWTVGRLSAYVGGLSSPSKMPGWGYSLPALECGVGGRLRAIAGSVCQGCYAMKGRYVFPNVQRALYRRLRAIDRKLWVPAMAELIRRRSADVPYFRWHDSGDLQSPEHLGRIADVARATPEVRHWLPTREYRHVAEFVDQGGEVPANLNIRLSAHMVGGHVPTFPRLRGLVTVSTVTREGDDTRGAYECPSRFQDNQCGDCRACWSPDVATVTYRLH